LRKNRTWFKFPRVETALEKGVNLMKLNFHKLKFGLILIFWLLNPAAAVRADIAPPEPPKGTNIIPGSETTSVRMLAEKVVIEVSAQKQPSHRRCHHQR
jgi:hypothetical protein